MLKTLTVGRLDLRGIAMLFERVSACPEAKPRVLERASFALAFASADPTEEITAFFEGRPARYRAGYGVTR